VVGGRSKVESRGRGWARRVAEEGIDKIDVGVIEVGRSKGSRGRSSREGSRDEATRSRSIES